MVPSRVAGSNQTRVSQPRRRPMTCSISAPIGERINRRCKRAPWGEPCLAGSRSPQMAWHAQHQDQVKTSVRGGAGKVRVLRMAASALLLGSGWLDFPGQHDRRRVDVGETESDETASHVRRRMSTGGDSRWSVRPTRTSPRGSF
jgi:hypothetical protein